MNKILISAGTTALALKIKNKLPQGLTVQLGDADEIPTVLKQQYLKLPKVTSPSFAHQILKIALDNGITKILPLRAEEIKKLSPSITLFDEYNISILAPTPRQYLELKKISSYQEINTLFLIEGNRNLFDEKINNLRINGLFTLTADQKELALISL